MNSTTESKAEHPAKAPFFFEVKTTANWLTKKPREFAFELALLFTFAVFLISAVYHRDVAGLAQWMVASRDSVFGRGEYWRLFSTLFVHADLEHVLSNSFLLLVFGYLLLSHFSTFLFPILALLSGAATNFLVLQTLPGEVRLLGISGVVYWMGGAWLTFYWLLDRRQRPGKRAMRAIFVALFLFFPETFREEISYLSHGIGFFLGCMVAGAYFLWNRKKLRAAEVKEWKILEDFNQTVSNVEKVAVQP